jgi:hypothetical protein
MKTILMFLAIFAFAGANAQTTTLVVKNHPDNPPTGIIIVDGEDETDEVLLGKFTGKILVETSEDCPISGDLNGSGSVDILDQLILLSQFGQTMALGCESPVIEIEEMSLAMKSNEAPGEIFYSMELLLNGNGSNSESIDAQQKEVEFEDIEEDLEQEFDIEVIANINGFNNSFQEGSWVMVEPTTITAEDEDGNEVDVVFAKGSTGNKLYLYSNVINVGPMAFVSWDVVTNANGTQDVYFAYTANISTLGDDELYVDAGATGWGISFGDTQQFEVTDFYCLGCDMVPGEFFEFEPEDIHTCSIWGIVEDVPSGTFECSFTALQFYQSPSLGNPIPYPTELIEPFSITVP